jgi:endonuclease/exonuclease/phosphatase family metal-dependent hydrolase
MTAVPAKTCNLRLATPDDDEDAWQHRREHAASVVRFHRPDVVGAQEALSGQYADLREALPEYDWVGVDRKSGEVGGPGEHTPVGVRTDRLELREHDTFWLSESPETVGSVGWDASIPRTVTWARLRDRRTDAELTLFNTHLDHQGERARRESARLLAERLPDERAVLLGDFNCTPADAPYQRLVEDAGLADAREASAHPHHGPTGTFHGFTGDADQRLDYVLATPDVAVSQHATLADHWDGRYPSDHFPVVADCRPGESA